MGISVPFPHGSQQTQRYFNVSSPSSRRDKKESIRLFNIILICMIYINMASKEGPSQPKKDYQDIQMQWQINVGLSKDI